jgi:hypothetical protein
MAMKRLDSRIARVLADVADGDGWDWADEGHDPVERLTLLPYRTGFALVYRGSEPDSATEYPTKSEAGSALREARKEIKGR